MKSSILFCRALLLAGLLAGCGDTGLSLSGTREEVPDVIRLSGELRAANSQNYGPPSVRKIWHYTISYMAPDGSRVEKGQDVVRFDTQELKTSILQKSNSLNEKEKQLQKSEIVARERMAELKLAVEEARAAKDKAELKADIPENLLAARDFRENQLLLRQSIVTLELREAELEREADILATEQMILEREIAVLVSEIDELEDSVQAMTIRAPTTGVVIHSLDHRGNKLAVGDSVWGGRRVVEFPDLSQLELHLEVAERDSARVHIGQSVRFTMDAIPDKVFSGEITELASVVHTKSINQPAKVFDATVSLADPDTELMRPGMSVNAEIRLAGRPEAGP